MEVDELLIGYNHREEQRHAEIKALQELEWERIAWQTAHLLNIAGKHLKKDVTVDILLGKQKPKKKTTPEESKQVIHELIKQMGVV